MQNSWLVSKESIFLVKGLSKPTLTRFQPMLYLWANQIVITVVFTSEMCQKTPVEEQVNDRIFS